ncbi:MAG: NAD(P)-dependent oxidoreductase, partial [Candidatus Eremiobacteraeota bacterium]|nr:NAD(P)-dependent oxidoreductase [Candidatus Eremiobacteraeota bacterium]
SARDAVREADVVVTMLPDNPSVESTLLGDGGAIAAAKRGTLFIDSSTVTPSTSRACDAAAKAKGMRFLDAPVTGSKNEAATAKLVFIVGGERSDYDAAAPILDAMGQKRFYCGPSGNGATLKLVNNAISATFVTAMAESALVVKSAGLDPKVATEFLTEFGAFASRLARAKLPKMLGDDFSEQFQLRLMAKDVRYFLKLAQEFGRPAPAIGLTGQLFAAALQAGWGADDMSAIHGYLGNEKPKG